MKSFQQRKNEVLADPDELMSAINFSSHETIKSFYRQLGILTDYGLSLTPGHTDTRTAAEALDELKCMAEIVEDIVETWIDTPEHEK